MRKIWKYSVPIEPCCAVTMPAGAVILAVQLQQDKPQLWALVDPRAPLEVRKFRWFGTGRPIRDHIEMGYVGTVQLLNGDLVFHLFESLKKE